MNTHDRILLIQTLVNLYISLNSKNTNPDLTEKTLDRINHLLESLGIS